MSRQKQISRCCRGRCKPKSSPRSKVPPVTLSGVARYILELHRQYNEHDRPEGVVMPSAGNSDYDHDSPANYVSAFTADWTKGKKLLGFKDFLNVPDFSEDDDFDGGTPEWKRNAFRYALKKTQNYHWAFSPRSTWQQDVGILAMADVHPMRELLYCRPGKRSRCKNPCFCPCCNFCRTRNEIDRLGKAFVQQAESFHPVTLSFNSSVPLLDDGALNPLVLVLHDMLEAVIREALEDNLFEGVLFIKEWSADGFLPATGKVHAHLLVFHRGDIRGLCPALKEMLCTSPAWAALMACRMVPGGFEPDFRMEAPCPAEDLRRWTYYAMKTFSVARAYHATFARLAPWRRWELNMEVCDLIDSYDYFMCNDERAEQEGGDDEKVLYRTAGRILRKGCFHWTARKRLTTPKSEWKEPEHNQLMQTLKLASLESASNTPKFSDEEEDDSQKHGGTPARKCSI